MGKKKKNWRRQINPEKSNKMIVAVGAGLLLLFAAFVFLTTKGGVSENKAEKMSEALNYLKKTPGIIDVEIIPDHNRVRIIFDSKDKKDFIKIARYAGLKLSYKLKTERLEIHLIDDSQNDAQYVVILKNGEILREGRLPEKSQL